MCCCILRWEIYGLYYTYFSCIRSRVPTLFSYMYAEAIYLVGFNKVKYTKPAREMKISLETFRLLCAR